MRKRAATDKAQSTPDANGLSSNLAPQSCARESLVPVSFEPGQVPKRVRVNKIVDLMVEHRWERGVTAAVLADEWGHSLHQLENDASEAAHILALAREPEAVREKCLVALGRVIEESGQDRVRAMELALKATGNLREQLDITHKPAATFEMYDAALEHPGFRAYLVEKGWTPPAELLLTEGESV